MLGALSNAFGRRSIFIVSIILLTAGTLICCLAQNFAVLLLGRTVQGIGSGGIITSNLVIITDIVPLRQRAKYYGITQVALAGGMVAGPLIGGAIAQSTTWRWLFYINFPFCVAGLVTAPWMIRVHENESENYTSTISQRNIFAIIRGIDWIGLGLFIVSTTSFLIAITWGGHDYAWSAYQTLLPMLLGLAGIGVTLGWEFKYATAPFIRPDMLRSRSLLTARVYRLAGASLVRAYLLPRLIPHRPPEQVSAAGRRVPDAYLWRPNPHQWLDGLRAHPLWRLALGCMGWLGCQYVGLRHFDPTGG